MKVFLSHSHEDDDVAKKVRNYLISHGIHVFDDKVDISTGSNLSANINRAIKESDAVLFFISKNAEKSEWVRQEMSLAVSQKFKGKDVKLIPVILERNAEIPFFLKDYVYLDIAKNQDFDRSMRLLVDGLEAGSSMPIDQEIAAKVEGIEIEKEVIKLKALEYEGYRKFKDRQMFFATTIATLISSVVVSVGFLAWVARIDYSRFEWLIAFSVGAIASMIGSLVYMRKERPNKDALNKKINDLHEVIRKMEARHDR